MKLTVYYEIIILYTKEKNIYTGTYNDIPVYEIAINVNIMYVQTLQMHLRRDCTLNIWTKINKHSCHNFRQIIISIPDNLSYHK